MANPEHVKILKQGADAWNQWRKEDPIIFPDLSSTDLRGANLRGANLGDVNLIETFLASADLRGADPSNATLRGADLRGANLSDANLIETYFASADLRDADFSGAKLGGNYFMDANLSGTDLSSAKLGGTNFSGADLSGANLMNAYLQDSRFNSANLRGVNLIKADLNSVDLSNANLSGASLYLSLRDYWKINEIKCDYIYWDVFGYERTPKDRDFLPGEFEELYKWRELDNFEKLIRRAIEFPAEYKQAGASILNYFSEILHKKYPEANATVQIKQDGLKVTMIVDPVDGEREIIEKTLYEYGLVVTGKMTPEAFTDDRFLIMDLQNQLTFAKAQIENQARMLQFQNEDIKKKDIRIDRFLDIMESAIQRPVNIEIKQENANHSGTNNVNGSDVGIIGNKAKSEGGIHFNNNED